MTVDRDLQARMKRLAGPVDDTGVWAEVRRGARRRRRNRRVGQAFAGVAGAAALLLLAVFGYSVFFVEDELVVIDDVPVGGTDTTALDVPTDDTETLLQVIDELQSFIAAGDIQADLSQYSLAQTPEQALEYMQSGLLGHSWFGLSFAPDAQEGDIQRIRGELASTPGVVEIEYTSREEARRSWLENLPEGFEPEGEPPTLSTRANLFVELESGVEIDQSRYSSDSAVDDMHTQQAAILPGQAAFALDRLLADAEIHSVEAKEWVEGTRASLESIVDRRSDEIQEIPEEADLGPKATFPMGSADVGSLSIGELWAEAKRRMVEEQGTRLDPPELLHLQIEDGVRGMPDGVTGALSVPVGRAFPAGAYVTIGWTTGQARADWREDDPAGLQERRPAAETIFRALDEIGLGMGAEILGATVEGEDRIEWTLRTSPAVLDAGSIRSQLPANIRLLLFDGSPLRDLPWEEAEALSGDYALVDLHYMRQVDTTSYSSTDSPRAIILIPLAE